MKNIRFFDAPKYAGVDYEKIEEHIYRTMPAPQDEGGSLALREVSDENLLAKIDADEGWSSDDPAAEFGFQIAIIDGEKYYRREHAGAEGRLVYLEKIPPQPVYVTSIVFEPEPELDENEPFDPLVSQYPLDDILDKYRTYCFDGYEAENASDHENSYVEFASEDVEDIRNLLEIIGKHVYNREEGNYIKLIIEYS